MSAVEIKHLTTILRICLFIVTTWLCSVMSFPNGAPKYSCRNLIPGHSNGTQTSPPPYSVSVSNTVLAPGQRTTVSVTSTGDFPFLGFICAASALDDSNNMAVGTVQHSVGFTEKDLLKPITCSKSDPNTAMTHTSRRDKFRVQFEWTPPADAVQGQRYKMRCTVVQSFFRCWTGIQVNILVDQAQSTPQQGAGNNAVSNNTSQNSNNNAIPNGGISLLQQPPTNNQLRMPSPVNPNPNPVLDFPLPASSQNQDVTTFPGTLQTDSPFPGFSNPSDIAVFANPSNQIPGSSVPVLRSAIQIQNQINDVVQDPGANEIPLQTQSIDLALLIDLINLGVITLQDGIINFDPIQSPTFDSNIINPAEFSPTNIHSPNDVTPHQISRTLRENFRRVDFNGNNRRSSRRPNSRGVFQSSNPRPFNPNFNRIRQPRPIISNNV